MFSSPIIISKCTTHQGNRKANFRTYRHPNSGSSRLENESDKFNEFRKNFNPPNQEISLEEFRVLAVSELNRLFDESSLSLTLRGRARLFHARTKGEIVRIRN